MKKLFSNCLLLSAFILSPQIYANNSLKHNNALSANILHNNSHLPDSYATLATAEETFEEAAAKNNIIYRTFNDLPSTPNGYYIVSGIYSKEKKRDKALKNLKKEGFAPGVIKNPINGLNYVYIEYYLDWKKAIEVCITDFDERYTDDVWIMQVKNITLPETNEPIASKVNELSESTNTLAESDLDFNIEEPTPTNTLVENNLDLNIEEPTPTKTLAKNNLDLNIEEPTPTNTLTENDLDFNIEEPTLTNTLAEDLDFDIEEPVAKNTLKETANKNKLIQKADAYFDRMWYAEAAKLYEEALLKGDEYYSSEVIQKTADSYYYNTNMEKAYEWYDILYDNYGKDLSADNMFKYAHTLKGTGKYGRSKRIMRLYNKKVANDALIENVDKNSLKNEALLDKILATTNDDIKVKNIAVNSEYSDFSPMFLDSTQVIFASAKDSSFFQTKKYKWNDQPYLDLYTAKLNEESYDLKDAVKLSKKINTKYHEASVTFSADNNTMYFTRNNYGKKLKRDKNGVSNLKIYISKKDGDDWSEAIELPFNSDEYSTGHPTLSPDGKQLYFISDRSGTMGETDLFVVDVLGDNSFSEPRNLGPEVNTDKREMFPFFNGEKLYFSSDGHTGLGGLDIFETTYNEDKGFSKPKNLGLPINSNKDDFSYIIDKDAQKGFFASNRDGGKGDDDIYSFEKSMPKKVNAIAGVITELATGDLLPNARVELLDENSIKLKEVETGEDGSFIFENLDSNTKYNVRANKKQYFENAVTVNTLENDTINADIALKRLEELIAIEDGVKKLKTEMIHFDFDKSYIRKDAAIELDKMVAVMNEYPEMVIKIESHTDSRGSRTYNKYLSDKRAKSSRDYLIKQGIAPERIESAIGYGEDRLINECDGTVKCTEQAHFLNRRSEFIIIKM